MVWEEWADVVPASEIKLLNNGRQQEIEQPLIDLGYLEGTSTQRLSIASFQQQCLQAIQKFRKEYHSAGLLTTDKFNYYKYADQELDSIELELLHQLTNLDGEMTLQAVPTNGEVTIASRIIHYRLVVLGLFDASVHSPFGHKSINGLELLRHHLSIPDLTNLTIANLAGNIPLLTAKLLETNQLKSQVVAFRYQPQKIDEDILLEVTEEKENEDNEAELLATEMAIEHEIESINSQLFSKEEQEWNRLEKRQKNKQRKAERVEESMQKILDKQNEMLQISLLKAKDLQVEIDKRTTQQKQLKKDLSSQEIDVTNQKEKVDQLQQSDSTKLRDKMIELDQLKQSTDNDKDIAQLLVSISSLNHDLLLHKSELNSLNKNNGTRKAKRTVKNKIVANTTAIQKLQSAIKTQQKITNLESEIEQLKSASVKFQAAKQDLDHLKEEKAKTEKELKSIEKQLKKDQHKLTSILEQRDEDMAGEQLKLQRLNGRLKSLLRKVNGLSYRFKAQLKRSLNRDYYNQLKREVFETNRTDRLQAIADDPFNLFLIRLIQVRQWMNGYYFGRLDSQPGNRTFQSIVELTEEEEIRKLRLKYVLTKLGNQQNGFWLLNAQYYFECLVTLDAKTGPQDTTELIAVYESHFEESDIVYNNEVTTEAWNDYTAEIEEGLKGSEHRIRRFYYGVKSLARSIGRVIGKIVRFIVRGVKALIRIFKNFIKLLYKEIREGVRNFFDGMKFLFGNRTITTPVEGGQILVTKYDFDFDSTVLVPANCPHESLILHAKTCIKRSSNLHFSLTLCGKIIKWVFTLATGSLTWPRLAIKIAFYFKDLVIQYARNFRRRRRQKQNATAT